METKVRQIYQQFDKRRKEYDALQADQNDLEELKLVEKKIKKHKH